MPENNYWSHWEKTVFFDEIDVAIIGGGIVGVNAAIRLRELKPDWRVTIIERGILPLGASTKNAGFACFGSMTELLDDLKTQSEDEVFALVEKRWRGLQRLRSRVGEGALDYQSFGGYELFKATEKADFEDCKNQLDHFNQILHPIIKEGNVFEIKDDKIGSFGFKQVSHLIHNKAEGQINPGKMMKTLLNMARAAGVEIYSGMEVLDMENTDKGVVLKCNHQLQIKAAKVLLATNGFAKRLLPELDVVPARNQVLITEPISGLALKGCFHYDKGYYYFRNVGNRVLIGGGRTLAKEEETTDQFGHTSIIRNALVSLLDTIVLPGVPYEIDKGWSGILGVGSQKQPILSCIENNIYTAVRLGGMGVAIGTLVGEEAADMMVNT
ncbi:MAG: gamma-glutamylputrescine oxidase [Saprospiraceae bacterium]|jgi:gamma-glutamylputrescine oxidase